MRGIRLLPHFDPLPRRVAPADAAVSRRAGDRALSGGQAGTFPVLLVDGEVAGVWHRRRSGRRLRVTVEPFGRLSASQRGQLETEAGRVAVIGAAQADDSRRRHGQRARVAARAQSPARTGALVSPNYDLTVIVLTQRRFEPSARSLADRMAGPPCVLGQPGPSEFRRWPAARVMARTDAAARGRIPPGGRDSRLVKRQDSGQVSPVRGQRPGRIAVGRHRKGHRQQGLDAGSLVIRIGWLGPAGGAEHRIDTHVWQHTAIECSR